MNVARSAVAHKAEEDWRTAAGRAYYSTMHEGRDALTKWGFICPPRENIHTFVRLRFYSNTDPDLQTIGRVLERLGRLRNEADYELSVAGSFADNKRALKAILDAEQAIALIDQIEADTARRTTAVGALRQAWP